MLGTLVLFNNTLLPRNFRARNGIHPYAIAIDTARSEVFLVDSASRSVGVISETANRVVAAVPVGDDPEGVAYDPAKGEVFVANSGSDGVSVLYDSTPV